MPQCPTNDYCTNMEAPLLILAKSPSSEWKIDFEKHKNYVSKPPVQDICQSVV